MATAPWAPVLLAALAAVFVLLTERLDRVERSVAARQASPEQLPEHGHGGCAQTLDDCVDSGLLLFEGGDLESGDFEFAMVSDLDLKSRDPQRFLWRSFMKKGTLVPAGPHPRSGPRADRRYRVEWGRTLTLESETAKRNRSMELSELVFFRDRLLAMCDYTGLIFKVSTAHPPEGEQPQVFQRWAIADGDGHVVKPCKMEWATVRDGVLWVGSMGMPWTNAAGEVEHRNPEWVKTIDAKGRVRNVDWGKIYAALRLAANATYLWHEAVHYDARARTWAILPRKRSLKTPYDPITDELMGTNLLLLASDHFRDIAVVHVGPLQPDRGFTAIRKIPGTQDHFLALKVREVGDEASTWIAAFDSKGTMLLDAQADSDVDEHGFLFVAHVKYEGLEFV